MLFTQGYPGYARGVAAAGPGEFVVATAVGVIARYWPAQQKSEVIISGLGHQLYGVALTAGGGVVVAEQGTGRILAVAGGKGGVLADGLRQKIGCEECKERVCQSVLSLGVAVTLQNNP